MLASLLFSAAIWPISVTQYCQPSNTTIMIGVAKNQSDHFIYCEQVEQPAEHLLNVSYIRDNETFAEKYLTYFDNPETPSIHQKDFRSGELRLAEVTERLIDLQYQSNAHKKNSKVSILREEVDVVDAGFDNFVRNHWTELQEEKILLVRFASISHLKVLSLRISRQPPTKCVLKTESSNERFCFLVEIDNPLLRLILGNIKLTYDHQHRLVNFNGVVNINDEKESTQTANINYYYRMDYLKK